MAIDQDDDRDAWGYTIGSGANSISIVLREASRPLQIAEIEAMVRRLGLNPRGDVRRHLQNAREKGYVTKTPDGWVRVESAG